VVTVLAAAVVAAAAGGPVARLEELGGALRSEPAWRASYHQVYTPAGMTEGEEVDGTVWAAWPDHALFRSGDPVQRLMGMDARRVRLVDREMGSCDDHVLDEDEWSRIPLAAVLDPRTAVDRFTILELGGDGLALIPREPGGVARVEVTLRPDHLPAVVLVVDPQGATNRLQFGDWTAVAGPPDGTWLPEPPPGVACVTEPR
jgi:hypothetical protein